MKKQYVSLSCAIVVIILFGASTNIYAKESILYGGGPFYTIDNAKRDMIRSSGFTTIVLWTIHVWENGQLVLNDKLLVDNGMYVGRTDWPDELMSLKKGTTSVRRIEIAIGSWGVQDFERIESFINDEGTGPDSTLYKNFLALRNAIPAIDAVSYDDESNYDIDSSVALALMLNDMSFKITLCPYTYAGFWSSVYSDVQSRRPGIIDRIDLQCYAGGGGNNPGSWNNYFGDLHVTPGLWCYPNSPNGKTPGGVYSQLDSWNRSYNIAGGFMWLFDDMLRYNDTYPVSDYGSEINRALSIDPTARYVATLYQHCPYGSWSADFDPGEYTASDIEKSGGVDNDASSLTIKSGYKVTFYDGDNFTGPALVKFADDTCLVDDGWNDRVSSMIVDFNPVEMGHWQFNENSGSKVNDSSGNGFDGDMVNMDAAGRDSGKQCGGLVFDGTDDYVEIMEYKGITGSAARTCSAWINTTEVSKEILTWGSESCYGSRWIIRINENGALRTEVKGGYIIGSRPVNDGRWHHVAVVLEDDGTPDISEVRLYVDGKPDAVSSKAGEPIRTGSGPETRDVYIGAYQGSGRYFQGFIDEVRIHNYAMNDIEIQDIYSRYALVADLEPDGKVDLADFAVFAGLWQNSQNCDGDLTCDCQVDFEDVSVLIDEWLDSK